MRTCQALLVVFLLPMVCLAAPAVRINLTVTPATTLPGIPVAVQMEVTNLTDRPMTLPPHALLVARKDGGEPSIILWYSKPQAPVEKFGETTIPARGSVALVVPVRGSVMDNAWFHDARLNQPGHFELTVWLGRYMGEVTKVPTEGIASSSAILQINEPTGVDSAAWRRMLALTGYWVPQMLLTEKGCLVAREIVTRMPESQYSGWLATAGPSRDSEESAAILHDWLARAPSDEYTEWRQLRLALFEDRAWRTKRLNANAKSTHVGAARAILTRLLTSKDPVVSGEARELLVAMENVLEARRP